MRNICGKKIQNWEVFCAFVVGKSRSWIFVGPPRTSPTPACYPKWQVKWFRHWIGNVMSDRKEFDSQSQNYEISIAWIVYSQNFNYPKNIFSCFIVWTKGCFKLRVSSNDWNTIISETFCRSLKYQFPHSIWNFQWHFDLIEVLSH